MFEVVRKTFSFFCQQVKLLSPQSDKGDLPQLRRFTANLARQSLALLYFLAICTPFFDASADVYRKTLIRKQAPQIVDLLSKQKGKATGQLAIVNDAKKQLVCLVSDESCLKRILVLGLQKQERVVVLQNNFAPKSVQSKLRLITKKNKSLKNFKSGALSGASISSINVANISQLVSGLAAAGITLTPLETVLLAVIVQVIGNAPINSEIVAPTLDKIRGLDPDLAPAQRLSEEAYSGKWVVLDGRFAKSGNELVSSGSVNGELLFQSETQLLIKLNPGTGLGRFAIKNSAGLSNALSINVVAQPIVTPTVTPTVMAGAPVINSIQGFNPTGTSSDNLTSTAISGGQVLLSGLFNASGNELISYGTVKGTILSQTASQIVVQLATATGTATFAVKNSSGTSPVKSIQVLASGTSTGPKITKIQGFDGTQPVGMQFSETATSGKQVILTGTFASARNELISTGTVKGIIVKESTSQITIQLADGVGQAVFAIRNTSGLSSTASISVTMGGTSTVAPVIQNIQGYDVKQPLAQRRTATALAGGVIVLTGSFAAKGNQLVSTGNVPTTNILLENASEIYVGLSNVGGTATIAIKNSAGTSAPRSITVTGGNSSSTGPVIQSINGYIPTANGEMQTTGIAYSGGFVLLSGSFLASGNELISSGLVSGVISIETETQIVVRLSPGTGKAQFSIKNSRGLSAPLFIEVVGSTTQAPSTPTPTPTVTPTATRTPIPTSTPVVTATPTATPIPSGAKPVISRIVGLDSVSDASSINTSRAKAGTYVVLAGSFGSSDIQVVSLGTPGKESVFAGTAELIVIKLAPGVGTASFQVTNQYGSSNIVSIPVE